MRIRNQETLTCHGNRSGRQDAVKIMEAGLSAADPYYNTLALVKREKDALIIGSFAFIPEGDPVKGPERIPLNQVDRIFVFGAGKGVQRTALALEETLGDMLTGGRIIIKHGDEHALRRISVSFGGHPVPDDACVKAAGIMLSEIRSLCLTKRDLVLTIIGNGASSLMTLPPEGVSLESVKQLTQILQIEKGLPTDEVNKCRNQVDLLKGGRLTRQLFPARLIHIECIDVNETNLLGGRGYEGWIRKNYWLHTLPDQRTADDAVDLLKKHGAWDLVTQEIRHYLTSVAAQNPCLSVEEYEQCGGRFFGLMSVDTNSMAAAAAACRERGYTPHILTRKTGVEAAAAGKLAGFMALQVCREEEPYSTPCALLMTGELLVTVGNETGIGGRNQEFCVSAARIIAGNSRIVRAPADTDGTDGPGCPFDPQATALGCHILEGGVVDGMTLEEAKKKHVDLDRALETHGTSSVLWQLDSGIWATQNISLNDLILILIQGRNGERL